MAMSVEGSGGHWFSQMPRTGRIYQLIDDAGNRGNPDGRIGAIAALGESGDPRGVDVLVSCCRDRDPSVRRHAVIALGKIRSGRAVPALVECVRDRDEEQGTRVRAVHALASTRCESAAQGLKKCLAEEEEDPAVRSTIEGALLRIEATTMPSIDHAPG